MCRNNAKLLFELIFWFVALLTTSHPIICSMHEIDYLFLLYRSLACFNQSFKAGCMQDWSVFWNRGLIFRLSGVCPISMLIFRFMLWSVLFDSCLKCFNQCNSILFVQGWFKPCDIRHIIRKLQVLLRISFHAFHCLICAHTRACHRKTNRDWESGTHINFIGGHQWRMQLLHRARRFPSSPLA